MQFATPGLILASSQLATFHVISRFLSPSHFQLLFSKGHPRSRICSAPKRGQFEAKSCALNLTGASICKRKKHIRKWPLRIGDKKHDAKRRIAN